MSVKGKKVGFVGSGNMGEALIKGLIAADLVRPALLAASDVREERRRALADHYRIRTLADNETLVRGVDVVVLAVKPQIMSTVLREIAPGLTHRPLLISIAAGVSTAAIQAVLGPYPRLIRVMPNTPALVLQGAAAIAKRPETAGEDLETAREIFSAVGTAVVLDEELMDAVTGLSGSGPAYVAIVYDCANDGTSTRRKQNRPVAQRLMAIGRHYTEGTSDCLGIDFREFACTKYGV